MHYFKRRSVLSFRVIVCFLLWLQSSFFTLYVKHLRSIPHQIWRFLLVSHFINACITRFFLLRVLDKPLFERKLWKFLLLLVLAATQHKSALLFAPFYLLPLVKDSRKFILLAFVLFAPMWIFGDQIAKYLVMGSIFEQYASYLEQNEIAGAYTFALYMIILGVLMFGNYKQIVNADGRNNVFVCAVSIAIMLTPLTMIDPSNMRIVQYYSVFGLLVLPKCLISIQFRYNMDLSMIVFLFLAAYTLYRMEPYAFFWQDMELGINYGGGIINDNSIRY